MTIYAKIIILAAVLVALAVGTQAQTPEIDALRAAQHLCYTDQTGTNGSHETRF